jgi:peroxiredoxin Q/BCP
VRVFGLSPDGVKSHKSFAEKLGLKFPLLADPDRTLIVPLGVWVEKSLYGKKYMGVERSTFLVGPDGRIERSWRKVKPEGHALEVLDAL